MVYVLALLAGAVGAFAGWLISGGIIAFFAVTFGVPTSDAAPMYLAVMGPVGALFGLAFGFAMVLRVRAGIRAPSELIRRGAFMVAIITVIVAGVIHLSGAAIAHLGMF